MQAVFIGVLVLVPAPPDSFMALVQSIPKRVKFLICFLPFNLWSYTVLAWNKRQKVGRTPPTTATRLFSRRKFTGRQKWQCLDLFGLRNGSLPLLPPPWAAELVPLPLLIPTILPPPSSSARPSLSVSFVSQSPLLQLPSVCLLNLSNSFEIVYNSEVRIILWVC